MAQYVIRRLLLMIPTILGILLLNFLIIQAAPGGPVEKTIAYLKGQSTEATARISGVGASEVGRKMDQDVTSKYRGSQGIDPEILAAIEKQYGFDKLPHERFFQMVISYVQFDFGTSFFRDEPVIDLIIDKLPVSLSLGLWTTLIIYLVSIPLGIAKAVRDGSSFDIWTSSAMIIGYAIPSFLFAILLILLFAGGNYLDWFPLKGLVSDNWAELSWYEQVIDYFWHLALPLLAMVVSGFASLAMLTKNSFIEEIGKQYILTARAKGLNEKQVLYGHVFRNAMLIVIAGLPATLLGVFFTSSLLIEIIFSLDGLGLLGYEAAINRDYPVIFGTLFIFTLFGLVFSLLGDLMYRVIDPRIDFERRDV
jgi:microcin C transport system permease protein